MMLGLLGVAVIAVVINPLWRLVRPIVWLASSLGYYLVSRLTGVRFKQWYLFYRYRDWLYFGWVKEDEGWWPAKIVTAAAPSVAPSLAGLLLARSVDRGWPPAKTLTVVLVVVLALALFHTSWYFLFTIAATVALLAITIHLGTRSSQTGAIILLAWILLIGGLRINIEMAGEEDHTDRRTSPGILQTLTDVPAFIWMVFFMLVAIASLVTGARLILN
jgi:hypothetical protein